MGKRGVGKLDLSTEQDCPFLQQHFPGSVYMNHQTAPSVNSRKTTLPRNAIQWFMITHTLLGSIARKTCDYSVSAATVHVFHLCRAEECVKLIHLPQSPESLPSHFHNLNHSAGKSSTRAINFQKNSVFCMFYLSHFLC